MARVTCNLALFLAIGMLPSSASAVDCPRWNRLSPEQRSATIDRMIDNAMTSNAAKSYRVSKAQVSRCLSANAQRMEFDFDDVCSDRRTASKQAINNTFHRYIWSCVR